MRAAHTTNVPRVTETVHAQYKGNLSGSDQSSEGMENKAAKYVAGKKAMVRMATVFIDELSLAVASARALLALATSMLIFESS